MLIVCIIIGNETLFPIPYFILGLTSGQYNIFYNIKNKILIYFVSISSTISLVIWYFLEKFYVYPSFKYLQNPEDNMLVEKYRQDKEFYDHLIIGKSPIIAIFYRAILLLMIQNKVFELLFSLLKYYGKMALTNYMAQTLLIFACKIFIKEYTNRLCKCTIYLYDYNYYPVNFFCPMVKTL